MKSLAAIAIGAAITVAAPSNAQVIGLGTNPQGTLYYTMRRDPLPNFAKSLCRHGSNRFWIVAWQRNRAIVTKRWKTYATIFVPCCRRFLHRKPLANHLPALFLNQRGT